MNQPLIVITGPTASGKTGLALELAERHNGEIICADSRTIYKGMDIGTAKPTVEERARVPHHLLDVVDPGDTFSARDFQRLAFEAIAAIRARGKVPFLVGGTGLYIDAVVREYSWPEQVSDDAKKSTLQSQSIEKLQTMIKEQRLVMPENSLNKRHLINTLLRAGEMGSALTKPRDDTVVVAIRTPKEILEERIRQRAHAMFDSGVIQETVRLAERYGWDSEAMKSNIYPIVRRVIEGDLSQAEAIELFVRKDLQLAKHQLTWLRRYEYVKWFDLDEARDYIETRLR